MEPVTAQVEIVNLMGLHLRPASSLVQICNQYPDCEVELSKDGQTVNGKSIMSVIMLAAEKGSRMTVKVTGARGEELLREIVELITKPFFR